MKILVSGTGYVGLVTAVCLAEKGFEIRCFDVVKEKIDMLCNGKSPIYEPKLEDIMKKNKDKIMYTDNKKEAYKDVDVIFIGVGTPEKADGSANLDYVYAVADDIAENINRDCLVVIKSTVPVGTNYMIEKYIRSKVVGDYRVEVASNPEFLSQGTAVRDTFEAKRIVIGTHSEWSESILKKIYENFNKSVIVSTDICSAEMIKYASNDFLALKISYMNDIANLCELVGANIEEVAKGMSYDPRIGSSFLRAGIGYGGSCFPKDTKALKYLANKNGYRLRTVEAAVEVNYEQKTKLFKKASDRLITFNGLKVAVLGLTFKPGTDDLREAPSIDNIKLLLEQGANVYAYDPVGEENFKKIYPTQINYVSTPEEALKEANVCFVFTEWNEIKSMDINLYKKLMKTPLVYDGRNIYDIDQMKEIGVEYYSIGR